MEEFFGAVWGGGLEKGEGVVDESQKRRGRPPPRANRGKVKGAVDAVEVGGDFEEFGAGFEEVGVEDILGGHTSRFLGGGGHGGTFIVCDYVFPSRSKRVSHSLKCGHFSRMVLKADAAGRRRGRRWSFCNEERFGGFAWKEPFADYHLSLRNRRTQPRRPGETI